MALAFLNRVGFRATSTGTGSFVVASALTGMQTPAQAAGPAVVNATTYRYFAQSDDLTQWEYGTGVYTTGDVTLTRATILDNSSGGTTALNFSAAPRVYMGGSLANDLHAATGLHFVNLNGMTPIADFLTGQYVLAISNDDSIRVFSAAEAAIHDLTVQNCLSLEQIILTDASVEALTLTNLPALVGLDIQGLGISTLDLAGTPNLEQLYAGNNSSLTSVDFSDVPGLVFLLGSGSAITSLDVTGLSDLLAIQWQSAPDLTSVTLTGAASLIVCDLSSCSNLATITMPNNPADIVTLNASGGALDQANVDGVLVELDEGGASNGTCNLSGGTNASPSGTGTTAKGNLEGRGWTVTVN